MNFQCLFLFRSKKPGIYTVLVILFVLLSACSDQKPDLPYVLDLHALPKSISIGEKYFYSKPFSIRAKYSDETEKNISSRIIWLSENISLLKVNNKGELEKIGRCLQKICIVSVIATDSESGKSLRLTVNIHQIQEKNVIAKKKIKLSSQNKITAKEEIETPTKFDNELALDIEDSNDAVIENINVSAVQGFQFSTQKLSSKTIPSKTETVSNVYDSALDDDEIPLIRRIVFKDKVLLLNSGEEYIPQVMAFDIQDNIYENHGISYECFTQDERNPSVIIYPGCELVAVKPGEVVIGLRLSEKDLGEIDSEYFLKIQVNPIEFRLEKKKLVRPVNLSRRNFQIWYRIAGLDPSLFYQAKIISRFSQGMRLMIHARSTLQYPDCVNTIPAGVASIACIFQVREDGAMLVVENTPNSTLQASMEIAPVDYNKSKNEGILDRSAPKNIGLGRPQNAFILSNENGGNRHYYVFESEDFSDRDLIVKLYDFSALVKLSVTWESGYCNEYMLKVANGEITCRVPAVISGRILIEIDGNNAVFDTFYRSAVMNGGAYYNLSIEYAN